MNCDRSAFFVSAVGLLLALSNAACGSHAATAFAASQPASVSGALPGIQVVSPLPDHDWTTPLGDLSGTRFSPIAQINTGNVSGLKLVSSMATGIPHGHE